MNKTAVKYANGTLDNWRLSFSGNSNYWKGGTATIEPDETVRF